MNDQTVAPSAMSNNLIDGRPAMTAERSVRRWAIERPDDAAFVTPDGSALTWRELDESADRCAGYLAALGVGPHSRIGWLGRNDIAYPILYIAARRRRAALAGFNWRLATTELIQTMEALNPELIVIDHHTTALADAAEKSASRVVLLESSSRFPWDTVEIDPEVDLSALDIGPGPGGTDEISMFWFTSGSTGAPKAAALGAERNELHIALPTPMTLGPDSKLLVIPPVFHIAGSIWVQYCFTRGCQVHFISDTSPGAIVHALADRRITHVLMVPTLLAMLVDELRERPRDLSLEAVCYGTAPIAPTLLRECISVFGCEFNQVYGMTEAGGVVACLTDADHQLDGPHAQRTESTGKPLPGSGITVEVRRMDDTGSAAAPGEPGELYVRTPTLMLGYWLDGHPVGSVLSTETYWPTGDLARTDEDGYVYILGRTDDMIITGGENVQPTEVEAVIAGMEGVSEIAVFGVSDAKWGQRVAAAAVVTTATPEDIVAYSRDNLAHYKCPTSVTLVPELPRTATGKLLRGRLRSAVEQS